MNIEFYIEPSLWRVAAQPFRASKAIPRWWKDLQREIDAQGAPTFPSFTAKTCSPVFDVLTAGYIIPLPFDLHVQCNAEGDIRFNWLFAPGTYVDSHPPEQIPIYGGAWKLVNPWVIKTPPGYSVLIAHPFHRPDLPFHTLEAVVDTDTYHNRVNFPFLWEGGEYDGVLRAGTPFAQVIPFQREQWTMNVHAMTEEETRQVEKIGGRLKAHLHEYRRTHHKPKHYRGVV